MYRSCIFCSAPLGSNDSIERFPVGRRLAFDGEKGRLWAVCPRCARWNLAPIEERWEAIEDAERLFRDTRVHVQRENIGLARLRDGTRLVRVGEALPGEVAAWRYGGTLIRRYRAGVAAGGALVTVGVAGTVGGLVAGLGLGAGGLLVYGMVRGWERYASGRVVQRIRGSTLPGGELTIRYRHLFGARLVEPGDGEIGIRFPLLQETVAEAVPFGDGEYLQKRKVPLTVTGQPARSLLARAMVYVNDGGATRDTLQTALERIEAAGSARAFMRDAAKAGRRLVPFHGEPAEPLGDVALEMALHEETERRALQGELAMLQAMWRDAEQIAAIADRLPDLPAPARPGPER